jgi:hypothetical protein
LTAGRGRSARPRATIRWRSTKRSLNRDRVSTAGAGLCLLGGSRSLKSLRSSAELIALPGSRYDHKIDSTQRFVAWGKRPSSADAWLAFYGGPRAKR